MNTYKMKVNAVYFGVSVISPKLLASPPLYSRNFAFGYRRFIRMRKDWLNGYKNKTPIYVVYKRPTSKQTHTD